MLFSRQNWALMTIFCREGTVTKAEHVSHCNYLCSPTQLLMEAGFGDEVEELIEYVWGLGDQVTSTSTGNKTSNESATIVLQTVEDLLTNASGKSLPQVSSHTSIFSKKAVLRPDEYSVNNYRH